MEKMRRRTQRGTSSRLVRIWAGLMAVIMVIGLMPEAVSLTVNAAESSSAIENEKIKGILGHDDYVPQITRTRERRSTQPNDTYIYNGGYYYSTKNTTLYDEIKKENYSGAGGICTWCAFTNLLNRRIALDGGTKAVFEANKYDILNVAKRIGNTNDGVRFSVSGQNDYIWIGNKREFVDVYTKSFDNGKGRSYTGDTKTSINNIELNTTRKLKDDALTKRINEIKEKLKNELDAHPEGIVIQFSNDVGMHGIVLTGYYYTNGYLSFYTVDTGGSNYGDGFTPIEDSYLGTNYGNKSFQGVKRIDNIVKYITSYTYIISASGSLVMPDPNAPVSINNLSIEGKSGEVSLIKGSANLMGTVTSGKKIKSVNAVVTIGSVTKYNYTIYPETTTVDLKESGLNKGANCIKFGGFDPGTYLLTVTADDGVQKISDTVVFTITLDGSAPVNNPSSSSIKISGLSIAGGNTFTKGSRDLCGTITSDADITSVKAVVTYPSGSTKMYGPINWRQQKTANSKKVDIKTSALNSSVNGKYNMYIRFADFGVGEYKLTVTATDANNNTATDFITFRVVLGPNEIAVDWNGFKNVLEYDQRYTIPAKITAGSDIVRIEGKVVNALDSHQTTALYRKGYIKDGVPLGEKEASAEWTGSKTEYDVAGSDIDSIAMGGLYKGYYSFVLTITLRNGTKRVFSRGFVVQ